VDLRKVSLAEKFGLFSDAWAPKIVGELDEFHVKLVKVEGEFVWHHHDTEDELFYVFEGAIDMHYRNGDGDRIERFRAGEFLIVPHGVEHKPVAPEGAKLVLIERKTTRNTGTAGGDRSVEATWL
jgi:mannose-6-phosphate isomerase-like protein (cupin superfamily)